MRALHADAIVTGDAETLRDGAVVGDAAGEVVEVGPAAQVLTRHAGAPVERLSLDGDPVLHQVRAHLVLVERRKGDTYVVDIAPAGRWGNCAFSARSRSRVAAC